MKAMQASGYIYISRENGTFSALPQQHMQPS